MQQTQSFSRIVGTGGYLPGSPVSNDELVKRLKGYGTESSDEWIRERTGITSRYFSDGITTCEMGFNAAGVAISNAGIQAKDIDLIIVATITPDHAFPSTANIVTHKLGAKKAWGFDMSAACSGFLYALDTGSKFIESGKHQKVIICGADKMSSIVDYKDRNTCVIFGDGGAAVLLEPSQDENGIIDSVLKSDGVGIDYLNLKAGGSRYPSSHETLDNGMHYLYQEGKTVFKFAVTNMADVSREIMDRNNLTGDNVDYLCAHQANLRIIDATARRMDLDEKKVLINISKYGNTTAGTIPLLFSDFESKFKKGEIVNCFFPNNSNSTLI